MTERQKMLVLPAAPVDGYEVRLWRVDWVHDVVVHQTRYVYRAATEWKDLFPEDDRSGAPFRDEWQVFVDDHFSGRMMGWGTLGAAFEQSALTFASEAEAVDFAIECAESGLQVCREKLQRAERNLEFLRSVWAALPEKST